MSDSEFRLTQIGIIMLGVKDVGLAAAFYRDKLGLDLKTAFEGFAFFNGGGVTLVLSEGLARAASGSIAGGAEVVFPVADVRAAYQALRGKGVEFTIEPRAVSGPMWAPISATPTGTGCRSSGPNTPNRVRLARASRVSRL